MKKPSRMFLDELDAYSWPGNVRELQNLAEKFVALRGLPGANIFRIIPSPFVQESPPKNSEPRTLNQVISDHVLHTLSQEEGNIARTATRLGIDRNTVKRWLAKARI